MISCLDNYIGLLDVTVNPTSGRYVNELPGIDTAQFDLIRKDEAYDIDSAWNDIETRAIRKFETKLNQWGARYFRNFSYVENNVTAQYINNDQVPSNTDYRGWLFRDWASWQKNLSLNLQFVELYSTSNVTSSILVFDARTGDQIDAISFDFVADQINRVFINKQYPLWKYTDLFICYDAEDVTSLKVRNLNFGNFRGSRQGKISNSATVLKDNIAGVGTEGQGLILTFSLNCAWDNFVCQRIQLFEEPYMYALGVEFCNERLFSDRINQYTLLDHERAINLRDQLNEDFESMMDSALKSLSIDFGPQDYCFRCSREINYAPLLP